MKLILKISIIAALFLTSCQTVQDNPNAAKGTGIGAAAGAVIGGIIGHQTGNREQGAIAGAILGGGIGAAVGHRLDKQKKELEKIAETKRTEQGLITKLKSDILFETGKSDLKPKAKENIKELLLERLETLDVEKAKNDVQPFIKDMREIELWSKEFFVAVIENIKVK